MVEGCNPMAEQIGRKQMMTTGITPLAFPRFTTGNFQMVGEFFAETAPEPFFNICADGIQTANLLSDQFAPAVIHV